MPVDSTEAELIKLTISLSSQTLGFHIQCLHYKPVSTHFCSREGGGVKCDDVTVNIKEENSSDFCPNYVQEFDLCTTVYALLP